MTKMKNFIQKLEEYGAKPDEVLSEIGGDVDFYQECLQMLLSDEAVRLLSEQYELSEQGNAAFCSETATDLAHSLKGVAANLGLSPLKEALAELVAVLRAKDEETARRAYKKYWDNFCKLSQILQQNK